MAISKASANWNGTLKSGKGGMVPAHGTEIPFTAGTRFEGVAGSNPEELIGAAFAGCFSMALSLGLELAGGKPQSIKTNAEVSIEKEGDGFMIKKIALVSDVKVDGLDAAKVKEIAEATRKGCPVAKALAAVPTVTLETRVG